MKMLFDLGEILGAIASSKMTGDGRLHARWILKLAVLLTGLAYLAMRI